MFLLYLKSLFSACLEIERIVFVSYNILGVDNAAKHQDLYRHVRPEFLKWRRRKRLITREVKRYRASIICFQASFVEYVMIMPVFSFLWKFFFYRIEASG